MAKLELMYGIAEATGIFGDCYLVYSKGRQQLRTVPPWRRQYKHSKKAPKKKDCRAFKEADLLYQRMPAPARALWARARKKPGISAYSLWMKECMSCFNQDLPSPASPSISGGYSTSKVD